MRRYVIVLQTFDGSYVLACRGCYENGDLIPNSTLYWNDIDKEWTNDIFSASWFAHKDNAYACDYYLDPITL